MMNEVTFIGEFIEIKEREQGEHELVIMSEPAPGREEIYSFIISDAVAKALAPHITENLILGVSGHLEPRKIGYNRLNMVVVDTLRVMNPESQSENRVLH